MDQSTPETQQVNMLMTLATLRRQLKSGANNFYWIAALSVINSVIALFGGTATFVIGLGFTQIIDGLTSLFAQDIPTADTAIRVFGIVFSIGISGVFATFGFFGGKGRLWAFWAGMVLYALDGLLLLAFQDWLGFGFHIFLLWGPFNGIKALKKLQSFLPEIPIDMSFPQDMG
ncbi:MAG: hypothetical protein L3J16_01205 [Anaerolineales bacterium]|nr:hypothetical protein [Anaerolineales bacterium]